MLRVALLASSILLSACGLKGNLYLPDKSPTPVVTNPATPSSSSSSSSESSAP